MQRASIAWRSEGRAIALVPTMGYLHPGHAGLIRRARSLVGRRGIVVVSIFVNPTQFAPSEDLAKYPRDLSRDRRLCQDNSVDALFLPSEESMYPGRITGAYSTYVTETCLSKGMEGTSRPTHFQGVTTVVAKLFNCVLPHISVFGEKDFQQAAVIKRMTADLNFPIKIVIAPTTREADGLAMSSRNSYLSEDQRRAATCLMEALRLARSLVRKSPGRISTSTLKRQMLKGIETHPSAKIDYVEFFNPETLQPVRQVQVGCRCALAVWIGQTRLIDNASL